MTFVFLWVSCYVKVQQTPTGKFEYCLKYLIPVFGFFKFARRRKEWTGFKTYLWSNNLGRAWRWDRRDTWCVLGRVTEVDFLQTAGYISRASFRRPWRDYSCRNRTWSPAWTCGTVLDPAGRCRWYEGRLCRSRHWCWLRSCNRPDRCCKTERRMYVWKLIINFWTQAKGGTWWNKEYSKISGKRINQQKKTKLLRVCLLTAGANKFLCYL